MDIPREWIRMTLNISFPNSTLSPNLSGVWDSIEHVLTEYHKERLTITNLQNLILITLYVITFIVATSANTIALVVFWRFQHMRCLSNSLLITLAVSDLLVSLVCMPMAIGFYTYKLWIFGEVMCKLANYLQGVAVAASVFTMTVMSVDRYVVICHPIAFRKHLYRRHVGWSILLVWLLALLLFVPVLIVRNTHGILLHAGTSHERSFVYCVEDWSTSSAREWFAFATFTLVFVIPGATMTAAYCRIGVRLCGGSTGLNRTEGQPRKQSVTFRIQNIMERRKLVAKRFLILTTVFAVCWVPYNIATLLLDFQVSGNVDLHLFMFLPFGLLLGHVNSAINPLLYCWVNKRFRKCVALTFRCGKPRDAVWDRRDIFQCQEYPMTIAASLRSSSLVWKKSLKKVDSHNHQRADLKNARELPTSGTIDSGCSK
ncbi:QRFP-like peptide receptor [Uloborus diversus]|uniref:QRFP-like peptide receptor n=1 Tax=Uloborus diversus TaxID=327109 RepID=UPI00240A2AD4|nr:QRFP-like peptide receptor [Uloborus diversus]